MNDINQPVAGINTHEPLTPSEPLPPPPEVPSGSFVIADLQQNAAQGGSVTPPVPQMTVETIPDTPIAPSLAPSLDPLGSPPPVPLTPTPLTTFTPEINTSFVPNTANTQPVETPFTPPTSQSNSFVPQGLMNEQPPAAPPFVTPQQSGGGRNPLKLVFILLLIILLGLGAILGIRLGSQAINNNKEVTITYWGLWENDAIIRPIIDAFEAENPKINVSYVAQNYTEYRQRLESAINRGDGPDLFRFHATWIPMLRNQIEPVPTDVMPASEFTSKYYPVMVNDLLAGSTLWGIPFMIDGLGLYINDDLLASAGVSPPKTYEELLSIVPRLTVKDGNSIITSAIALGTANNIEHFSDILGLMITQNGGSLSKPTGQEAEEAVVFYRKFATPSDPLYTWNELQDNSVSAFANGRVAMMFAPSWRAFDVRRINPNLQFHIDPVPQLPGSKITWASYWVEGVSSQSKNQKQAFAFLKYLTSQESAKRLYAEASRSRLFGPPYALKDLGLELESDPFVGAYIKQAMDARSFPLSSKTHDNGINDQMIAYMEDAINSIIQGTSPTQALTTMSQGFQQVLSRFGLATSRTTQ